MWERRLRWRRLESGTITTSQREAQLDGGVEYRALSTTTASVQHGNTQNNDETDDVWLGTYPKTPALREARPLSPEADPLRLLW